MHGRNPDLQKLRLRIEHPDESFRKCQSHRPGDTGIDGTYNRHETDALLHPVLFFGSIIKTDDRLRSVGRSDDHHGQYLPDGIQDGHNPHVPIAAVHLQLPVTGNLHHAVGKIHDKAGNAKRHDLSYDPPVR